MTASFLASSVPEAVLSIDGRPIKIRWSTKNRACEVADLQSPYPHPLTSGLFFVSTTPVTGKDGNQNND